MTCAGPTEAAAGCADGEVEDDDNEDDDEYGQLQVLHQKGATYPV